jgi:NADPH:quinone reductase-like Zn-dependent oxidoreductase
MTTVEHSGDRAAQHTGGTGPDQPPRRRRSALKWAARITTALVALGVAAFVVAYWRSDNECSEHRAVRGPTMKAVTYCDYGSPQVLELAEVAKPVPADDEILVRIRAASVNPLDWHYMRGLPYLVRLENGLRRPASIRLGVDYSGTVDAIGRNVTQFRPGDNVFGLRSGAFGEYVAAKANRTVVTKPDNVSFEEAAAVPVAALTALQGLRDKGHLVPGQKVLVNGASGGVGTYAVQIAKEFGGDVTGVCSTRNVAMVRGLGADHVIDYTQRDFTTGDTQYDLILDMFGSHGLLDYRRVMRPGATYVVIGGPNEGRWIGPLVNFIKVWALSPFVSQKFVSMLTNPNPTDLATLRDLMQAGKLRSVIDRRYDLSQTAEAVAYLEKGHARGKVVITVP